MSTLPIEQSWLVIANLSSELHKKGIPIPKELNKDLGLVKSQIGFYKKDPSHPDMINEMAKADMSLNEIHTQSRFIQNVPPGLSYAKITLRNPIAEDRVQEIAEYYGLIMEFDTDSTIALYGEKSNIQLALKEMAPFFAE